MPTPMSGAQLPPAAADRKGLGHLGADGGVAVDHLSRRHQSKLTFTLAIVGHDAAPKPDAGPRNLHQPMRDEAAGDALGHGQRLLLFTQKTNDDILQFLLIGARRQKGPEPFADCLFDQGDLDLGLLKRAGLGEDHQQRPPHR